MESIDVNIDDGLPEKAIEDHEVEPFFEQSEEEEPEKEEENEETQREPQNESSETPSKIKFVQRCHPEEQVIGNIDEGIQTRRRMISTPRKDDVALLSLIEPENFSQASKDPFWIKAMEEEMSQIEKKWDLGTSTSPKR